MGEVYLAQHQLLKRPSAIKLIRPGYDTDATIVARFEQEVQATAKLTHWNTVEIFDYGRTEDGTFYYVMEYLTGKSLQQLVETHGPMPPSRVVHFLGQVCDALFEAHDAGMIHQDIKPANIFATHCGCRFDVAKLLDFGLVREIKEPEMDATRSSKRSGPIVGTPRFMSPEQAQGIVEPDIRSDIYSLGATAYYLLTSRPVFTADKVNEVLQAHIHEPAEPPSHFASEIADDLERVILKCLEKKPQDRYACVGELRDALMVCECAESWSSNAAALWWNHHESSELNAPALHEKRPQS